MYPESTELDPYDARTWPEDVTCAPHQDIRVGFSGTVTATNASTGQNVAGTFSRVWNAGDSHTVGIEPDTLALGPGETVSVNYTMEFAFPARDTNIALGSDGLPIQPLEVATELRVTEPSLEPASLPGMQIALQCDDPGQADVDGQTIAILCHATIARDNAIELPVSLVTFQVLNPYETRQVAGGNTGPWTSIAGAWDGLPLTVGLIANAPVEPVQPPTVEEPASERVPELAATGTEAGIVAPLALGLISIGSALLLTRRRKGT